MRSHLGSTELHGKTFRQGGTEHLGPAPGPPPARGGRGLRSSNERSSRAFKRPRVPAERLRPLPRAPEGLSPRGPLGGRRRGAGGEGGPPPSHIPPHPAGEARADASTRGSARGQSLSTRLGSGRAQAGVPGTTHRGRGPGPPAVIRLGPG